jgi:hypothetical protein
MTELVHLLHRDGTPASFGLGWKTVSEGLEPRAKVAIVCTPRTPETRPKGQKTRFALPLRMSLRTLSTV